MTGKGGGENRTGEEGDGVHTTGEGGGGGGRMGMGSVRLGQERGEMGS